MIQGHAVHAMRNHIINALTLLAAILGALSAGLTRTSANASTVLGAISAAVALTATFVKVSMCTDAYCCAEKNQVPHLPLGWRSSISAAV